MPNKIALVCNFSNSLIRSNLDLRKYNFYNSIAKLFGWNKKDYVDFGAWISVFASEFPKYPEYEFHIIAPHYGLKKKITSFTNDGVYYHFYKTDGSLISNFIDSRFKKKQRSDYKENRLLIKDIISRVNPSLVIISGAENPYYSLSELDIEDRPTMILLQTVLNNPKSIKYNVGNSYNREVEKRVLGHAKYFGCPGLMYYDCLKQINPNSIVFKQFFPIQIPPAINNSTIAYDFVFYASVITKNKGIEDLILAFAIVCKKYPNATLNIIGRWPKGYKDIIKEIIASNNISNNIFYNEYFPLHNDVFSQISKSRFVVVPGITALINSTVLEPMFMKKPVITYATTGTPYLNKIRPSVLLAENENVYDLAEKMIFAIENEDAMDTIANNGFLTANEEFSPSKISFQLMSSIKIILDNYYNDTQINKSLLFDVESFKVIKN